MPNSIHIKYKGMQDAEAKYEIILKGLFFSLINPIFKISSIIQALFLLLKFSPIWVSKKKPTKNLLFV